MRFILIGVLAFAVGLPAGIQRSGLLMNYSDSVPLGLYRRVPANSANRAMSYAGFCLPRATANAAIQAGLEVVPGACPGGLAPVLTPVICPSPEHPLTSDA